MRGPLETAQAVAFVAAVRSGQRLKVTGLRQSGHISSSWRGVTLASGAAAGPIGDAPWRLRRRRPRKRWSRVCFSRGGCSESIEESSTSSPALAELLEEGLTCLGNGDYRGASEAYGRATSQDPRCAAALCGLGKALIGAGRLEEGFNKLADAFAQDSLCPGLAAAFREYYQARIEADPDCIDAHEGLAFLCMDSGRHAEAAASYRRCLALAKGGGAAAVAAAGVGSTGSGSGGGGDGGGGGGGGGGRSIDLSRRDRWAASLFKCMAACLDWSSWDADARALAATVGVRRHGEADEGGDGAEGEAEEARPQGPVGLPPAVHPFDSLSSPLSIEECAAVARQHAASVLASVAAEGGRPFHPVWVLPPRMPDQSAKPETVAAAAAEEEEEEEQEEARVAAVAEAAPRIRLGYVSGDLRASHPMTHLVQSLFVLHNRLEWEVFLYALNPADGSPERRRMEGEAEHFRDLSSLTAHEAAEVIHSDSVDILVNLNGHAGTSKSAHIFARRPAPLAVSYMGFPGTLGAPELADYVLADPEVIPEGERGFYSEKVIELPRCYFVNDYRQSALEEVASPAPTRARYGLPDWPRAATPAPLDGVRDRDGDGSAPGAGPRDDGIHAAGGGGEDGGSGGGGGGCGGGGVVLCNFNRPHKIDPGTFGAWMRVLRATPGAVLWLLDAGGGDSGPGSDSEERRRNAQAAAEAAGVDPKRVVWAPVARKAEHLRRLRLADVFVDTPLYNAHTVGCDALWAGVPIVTQRSRKMASRVAASLLSSSGLEPEDRRALVADSPEEYEALVLALARDAPRRARLRQRLEAARMTSPLFDTAGWVRDAEAGLRAARARHRAGLVPDHIRVPVGPGGGGGAATAGIDPTAAAEPGAAGAGAAVAASGPSGSRLGSGDSRGAGATAS